MEKDLIFEIAGALLILIGYVLGYITAPFESEEEELNDEDLGLWFPSAGLCPDAGNHNEPPIPMPDERLDPEAWIVGSKLWADKVFKTYDQSRCPTCGYYVIWTEKIPEAVR